MIRRLALFNMVYWNKGLYYLGLETRKIKNERVKTKKTNKEMISCRSHQSWFVLFMLLTRFYSCKQFIHVVSLGTRIAQSFGIPKTAEELRFFRLQLWENLFLWVFPVELRYSAIVLHPWKSNSREAWLFQAATLREFISLGVSCGTKI